MTTLNANFPDLESRLLYKIELGNISRQLKLKLSAIHRKINHHNPNSVQKLPKTFRRRRLGDSPFGSPTRIRHAKMTASSPGYKYNSTPLRKMNKSSGLTTPRPSNEEEGANLLMYLATSPSPYASRQNSHNGQVMSSPIRPVKSELPIPSTPRFSYKSSPQPDKKSKIITTPKIQTYSTFGGLSSTVIRTPNFNMSDYVNFLSPSPSGKKRIETPDRTRSIGERLNLERTNIEKLVQRSKDEEETEDEENP